MNTLFWAWRVYKNEPFVTRLHILGRAVLCPFSTLLPYFPASGHILDVGCGYGFLLHLVKNDISNKGRKLSGIDHDFKKINVAKKYTSVDMDFSEGTIEKLPTERFDTVSITDVLYCISLDKWKSFLGHCFRVLKKGGRLVVKEVVKQPGWKHWFLTVEEKLAVEVFKITRGDRPHLEPIETYCKVMEKSGFRIGETKPLSTWHPYNQCILIAHKR